MALVKHNNNSISAVTSMASLISTGSMTLIKEQTASSSASISFVDGTSDVVLDSTYPIYKFVWINCHPSSDAQEFRFNLSTDGGSNYNVTKTTTYFNAYHNENDADAGLNYDSGRDLAQSTSDQPLNNSVGNENDQSASGELFLFNPSSTTFVKHFISVASVDEYRSIGHNSYVAGYGNTTSAINAVQFKMASGNIDSGTIKLYGIKDS